MHGFFFDIHLSGFHSILVIFILLVKQFASCNFLQQFVKSCYGAFLSFFLLVDKQATIMQCWDACQPWCSLGHSWTLWKESSVGRIKWGMLQLVALCYLHCGCAVCILLVRTMLLSWDLFIYSSYHSLRHESVIYLIIDVHALRMSTSNGSIFCFDASLLETKWPMHSLRD